MKITFNIVGYIDRRTQDLQSRYEHVESKRWWSRRWLSQRGRPVQVVKRMESVGADRTEDGIDRPPRIWPATDRAPFRVVSMR